MPLLSHVLSIIEVNPLEVFRAVWELRKRVLPINRPDGMYEVLEYEACLELKDTQGKKAVYTKRQKVRFLQDKIIAFQDMAWGDGEIFADYQCSPGVPVDRYREGHRWRVLISLRGTKNRGDIETFQIKRVIKDGFTQDTEDFQTKVNHPTRKITLSIVFPKRRFPRQVILFEQNREQSMTLGPEHRLTLPDGRLKVTWYTDKPRLYEAYILRWRW